MLRRKIRQKYFKFVARTRKAQRKLEDMEDMLIGAEMLKKIEYGRYW